MKTSRIAFVATGLLAVGAGVAIAGLPGPAPEAIVVSPDRVTTTAVPTTVAPDGVDDTEGSGQPAATTTTVPPETTQAPTTTTSPPETTAPTTTVPLVDRADLVIGVANATTRGGVAAATVRELRPLGYDEMFPIDALEQQPTTMVHYQPGLDREASRLAVDAELEPDAIAPWDEAPATTGTGQFDLLLVLGRDR